jgi:Lipopolysaccharide-assembly
MSRKMKRKNKNMKNYKIVMYFLASGLLCLLPPGCGYHMGSVMHPQVKSIAIAPLKNDTIEAMATQFMRQALAEQFDIDRSLKLKSLEEADCVIYGRIIEVKTTAIGFDSNNNEQSYQPAEFALKIKFEFVVIIPGREKPLINTREVEGVATYQVAADNDIARRRGIQQACRMAAQKAVVYTVEAW